MTMRNTKIKLFVVSVLTVFLLFECHLDNRENGTLSSNDKKVKTTNLTWRLRIEKTRLFSFLERIYGAKEDIKRRKLLETSPINCRPGMPNIQDTQYLRNIDTVTLNWTKPNDGCAQIFLYKIFCKVNGKLDVSLTSVVMGNGETEPITTYTMYNLPNDKVVEFAVQAENIDGEGAISSYSKKIRTSKAPNNLTKPTIQLSKQSNLTNEQDLHGLENSSPASRSKSFGNAYGTSFTCTSVCHFTATTFTFILIFFVSLLFLIPVKKASYDTKIIDKMKYRRQNDPGYFPNNEDKNMKRGKKSNVQKGQSNTDNTHLRYEEDIEEKEPFIQRPDTSLIEEQFSTGPKEDKEKMVLKPPLEIPEHFKKYSGYVPHPKKKDTTPKKETSYENLNDEEIKEYEYLEFLRSLLGGLIVTLHGIGSRPVKRKIYIEEDLSVLHWVRPSLSKSIMVNKSNSMRPQDIKEVLTGMTSSVFKKRGDPSKSHLYLSICTEKTALNIEAENEAMHQKLLTGFTMIMKETPNA